MMAGWRVIPPGEGRGPLERFGTVLAVALIIAGIQSAFVLRPSTGFERFSVPMVYSVAISVVARIGAGIGITVYLARVA